jgi:DNA-binding transcriptional ArsR family regulator
MDMNNVFQALNDPSRRHIIELLAKNGQLSATAIADKFESSPPAISQHLKVLREAKLVVVEKRAQKRIYKINPKKMHEVEHWAKKLADMWHERFDRLEAVLEEEKNKIFISCGEEFNKKKK